jgi:hypothetical protein
MKINNHKKIKLVTIIAVLSMLILITSSPNLWFGKDAFPVMPRFNFIPLPNLLFTNILSGILVFLLVTFLFKPKKVIGIAIVLLYFYLALVDQNRLQPFYYQSILTILIVSYLRKSRKNTTIVLHCLMLLFIATYFWSGVHKINPNFNHVFTNGFNKRLGFLPDWLRYIGVRSIPFFELSLGVFLVFNKTRKIAIVGIVMMHLIITVSLMALGYGYVVIPWNLQNILSVIILFWTYTSVFKFDIFKQYFNFRKAIILFITFFLPLTNLFGFWDHELSYSFFSAKLNYYYIELDQEKLIPKLPKEIQNYIFDFEGKKIINLNDWAGTENGVLFYPEDRVAYKTEKYLQSFADNPNEKGLTKLVEYIQHKK